MQQVQGSAANQKHLKCEEAEKCNTQVGDKTVETKFKMRKRMKLVEKDKEI